jgi:hypothetical protein
MCTTKCVSGVNRHLTFRIATIGAVCVGFDEFADREAVCGLIGGGGDVLAHELVSFFDSVYPRFRVVSSG